MKTASFVIVQGVPYKFRKIPRLGDYDKGLYLKCYICKKFKELAILLDLCMSKKRYSIYIYIYIYMYIHIYVYTYI